MYKSIANLMFYSAFLIFIMESYLEMTLTSILNLTNVKYSY